MDDDRRHALLLQVLLSRVGFLAPNVDGPPALHGNCPPLWLQPERADCVVRFVHSDYKQQVTERELAKFFPSARNFSLDPMPLRSIFLAIAKSGRNHAQRAENESAAT